ALETPSRSAERRRLGCLSETWNPHWLSTSLTDPRLNVIYYIQQACTHLEVKRCLRELAQGVGFRGCLQSPRSAHSWRLRSGPMPHQERSRQNLPARFGAAT